MKKYAQNLFPNFNSYPQEWEKRQYVQTVLVELAENDKLSIVEIANQPIPYATILALQVIFGHMVQDGHYVDAMIPSELEDYRVKIKPIYGDSITYELPHTQVDLLPNNLPLMAKENRTIKANKDGFVILPLKEACRAMWRYGKNVRKARSTRLQSDLWRYEEVAKNGSVLN